MAHNRIVPCDITVLETIRRSEVEFAHMHVMVSDVVNFKWIFPRHNKRHNNIFDGPVNFLLYASLRFIDSRCGMK